MLALAAAMAQGCAQQGPRWEREFGGAVRANLAAQVLDPAAGANADPASGVDGRAARGAIERYQRSFALPPEPAPLLVGAQQ